jgi:uncharacterized membrane protein
LAEASASRSFTSGLHWAWNQITSRLWFRVSLFAVAAVLTTLVAKPVAPLVPEWITESIGERATWDILSILASSMLVVATFSLGTMVQAFAAATSSATPRAARILIDDPYSQNVLATFLGAFVFAMVGLVALGFGFYSLEGKTVLLFAASLVILLVISTFFAWLDHLANMVRLGETQAKIEARARKALDAHAAAPLFGGVAITDADRAGTPLRILDTHYVQHVDIEALQSIAEKATGRVAVGCLAGAVADATCPLAWTSWQPDADERAALRAAFTLGPERSFDQDPRFCLQVLAEIGSRALSPGINDPGTAIGILVGQQRLLTRWGERSRDRVAEEPSFPRVAVAPLAAGDLFDDAFGPFLRDGAGIVEVGLRLQKALVGLAALDLPGFADEARRLSRGALAQASRALVTADDRERLAAVAEPLLTEPTGASA